MLCLNCRTELEDGARFCPACGLPVGRESPRIQAGSVLLVEDWGEVRVDERLGEGGMGVVHRGWLEYSSSGRLAGTPGHPVAVKVLRPELRGRERARRMFQREATALERLAHPNVVRFVALYETEAQSAIVMEYVHGEPLSRVIRAGALTRAAASDPCIPLQHAWHTFAQLLGALAAVHAIGILHRDIKSANVLVRPDGVAKLTDFGIARLPESGGKNTGGMIPGTGAYMAPEQVRGEEIDPRADLYSAAIVLYEMLSGTTPFDTLERDELMLRTAQLEEPPLAITQRISGLPAALELVMARALAKDRRHRYATALELGEALREALGVPPDGIWAAQREFAGIAKTISEPVPQVDPEIAEQAERLRTAMMTPLGGH